MVRPFARLPDRSGRCPDHQHQVEEGGGIYLGTEAGYVWLHDPDSDSTLALPLEALSPSLVREALGHVRVLFGRSAPGNVA